MYRLNNSELLDFKKASETEVYLPNGLGGYLGVTSSNCLYKKQNSYLIGSLNDNSGRLSLVSKVIESVELNKGTYSLDSQSFKDLVVADGNKYLLEFLYDLVPSYTYDVAGVRIVKSLAPAYGSEAMGIMYLIQNNSHYHARFRLTPLFRARSIDKDEANEALDDYELLESRGQVIVNYPNASCYVKISEGNKVKRDDIYYRDVKYQFDYDNKDNKCETLLRPWDIVIDLKEDEFKVVEVVLATKPNKLHAKNIINAYKKRLKKLTKDSFLNDQFAERLALSADSFLYKRNGKSSLLAGVPSYLDFSRGSLLSLRGGLLVPKRFNEAREVLLGYKDYLHNGLLPNRQEGDRLLYNSADTSLWYFISCYSYYKYTNDLSFILDSLYPTLYEIFEAYKDGTDYNIHMVKDGLISAGSNINQVTWMDISVSDRAITPRDGKAVEINALWYNALKIMEELTSLKGDDSSIFTTLAKLVYESFNLKYWNKDEECLYDVIDSTDDSVRPNMLYSISLPFKLFDEALAKKIVIKCRNELFTRYGIRSLSINDVRFKPRYEGSSWARGMAYHMGTAWAYLLGSYIDAYLYAFGYTKDSISEVKEIFSNINEHMHEYCLNGISEIFDGEEPSLARGCCNQASSVCEILRAYYENLLSKNIKLRIDR